MLDLEKLKDKIKNISQDDIDKYFPKDKTPKGWVSIEDHLPKCLAIDFISLGYSTYKCKNANGDEFETHVTDHNTWYYRAKDEGITHWWNE